MISTTNFQKSAFLSENGSLDLFLSDTNDTEITHWHDDYEVLMPLAGNYQISFNDKCYQISKEDICMIPQGSLHCMNAASNDAVCLHLRISKEQVSAISDSFLYVSHYPAMFFWKEEPFPLQDNMVSILYLIYDKVNEGALLSHKPIQSLIHNFLNLSIDYLTMESSLPSSRNHSEDFYKELIHNVCSYISKHCMDEKNIDPFYDCRDFSKSYVSAIFKSYLRISINEFLLREKLLFSVCLLTSDSISIEEVCTKSGFHNIRTFHRNFQDYFHCSPSAYRKKYLQF